MQTNSPRGQDSRMNIWCLIEYVTPSYLGRWVGVDFGRRWNCIPSTPSLPGGTHWWDSADGTILKPERQTRVSRSLATLFQISSHKLQHYTGATEPWPLWILAATERSNRAPSSVENRNERNQIIPHPFNSPHTNSETQTPWCPSLRACHCGNGSSSSSKSQSELQQQANGYILDSIEINDDCSEKYSS